MYHNSTYIYSNHYKVNYYYTNETNTKCKLPCSININYDRYKLSTFINTYNNNQFNNTIHNKNNNN